MTRAAAEAAHMSAPDHVPNRSRRFLLLLKGRPHMSYEEAAQVCGVPLGTMKSRVHRGRMRLAELLGGEDAEDLSPDRMMQAVLQSAS